MQPGIAVSNGGEIVAVGSWGCLGGSNDNGSVDGGEILAFVGRNGKSNGMIYFFFKKNFFFFVFFSITVPGTGTHSCINP